jgi:hypothetical protein
MSAKLNERDRNDVLPGDLVCKDWNARTPEFGIVREVVAVPGRAWPDVLVVLPDGKVATWREKWGFAHTVDDDEPGDDVGPIEHRISSFHRVVARGMDREAAAKMYGLDASDLEPSS